jgi:hypothetical protein
MNTEDLQQHSFAIVSQLLEFWERNYLISKEDLALISAQQSAQGSRATGSGSNTNTTTNTNKPKEEETEVKVNEIPNVIPRKVGPKLKFGVQLPADKKPDGSWCYYTNQRDINVEKQSILYQTIFSRPTKDCPVPRATSTVWFELTKRVFHNNIASMEFRISI